MFGVFQMFKPKMSEKEKKEESPQDFIVTQKQKKSWITWRNFSAVATIPLVLSSWYYVAFAYGFWTISAVSLGTVVGSFHVVKTVFPRKEFPVVNKVVKTTTYPVKYLSLRMRGYSHVQALNSLAVEAALSQGDLLVFGAMVILVVWLIRKIYQRVVSKPKEEKTGEELEKESKVERWYDVVVFTLASTLLLIGQWTEIVQVVQNFRSWFMTGRTAIQGARYLSEGLGTSGDVGESVQEIMEEDPLDLRCCQFVVKTNKFGICGKPVVGTNTCDLHMHGSNKAIIVTKKEKKEKKIDDDQGSDDGSGVGDDYEAQSFSTFLTRCSTSKAYDTEVLELIRWVNAQIVAGKPSCPWSDCNSSHKNLSTFCDHAISHLKEDKCPEKKWATRWFESTDPELTIHQKYLEEMFMVMQCGTSHLNTNTYNLYCIDQGKKTKGVLDKLDADIAASQPQVKYTHHVIDLHKSYAWFIPRFGMVFFCFGVAYCCLVHPSA